LFRKILKLFFFIIISLRVAKSGGFFCAKKQCKLFSLPGDEKWFIIDKSIIDLSKRNWRRNMAEINDLLYQLRLADQTTTQLFEKRLGISLTRYQILQDLLEQAPCNQIAVQERLQIDPAALTRHFKILEKEGFVHRSRNPKNQREILIHLTDTAYNRLVKHPPRYHVAVKEQMSRILTAQEQEQFSYLLDKLVSGIEQITVE